MTDQHYLNIEKKFTEVEKKERIVLFFEGALKIILLLCGITTLLLFAELLFPMSTGIRTAVFCSVIFLSFILTAANFAIPYFIKRRHHAKHYRTAARVGESFPEIKDDLLNVFQLKQEKSEHYSPELKSAAFEMIFEKVKNLNFKEIISYKKLKRLSIYTVGFLSLIFILIISFGGLSDAAFRLIKFNQNFTPPPKFIFDVQPGDKRITKGDEINITIRAIGTTPGRLNLMIRSREDAEYSASELKHDSSGVFHYRLAETKSSFSYFAEAEATESPKYFIEVIDRPIISSFDVKIYPPVYSALPETVQKDNGNITALKGSRAKITAQVSNPLSAGVINFKSGVNLPCEINGASLKSVFNIKNEDEYFISVTDTAGNKNEFPINYKIKLLSDEFPRIEIVSPNKDSKIKENSLLPIIAKISDDYGFSKLTLNYKLSASVFDQPWESYKSVEIQFDTRKLEEDIYYGWDLSSLYLASNDVVSYYLEIYDNDNVSGPKSTKSPEFTVMVPSLDELFTDADDTQENVVEEMKDVLKESEDLQKEISKLNDELKKDDAKITWEEKEKIDQAVNKFEDLRNKAEQMQEKLNELQKELAKNDLLSDETMQKYMELQKLMDEMTSEELKRAFERMQQSLEQLMRQNVQQNMENFQMDEEAFKKSLERTLSLLKRIQVEQKIDELVKRTEALNEAQNKLNEELKNTDLSNEEDSQKAAEKQEQIKKQLDKLKAEMEKLQKMMSELSDMPTDEMGKMLEKFNDQQNQRLSEQAKQNMMNRQKMAAMQNQRQLSQNMQQMMDSMMNLQSMMMQQNQMKVMAEFLKIINSLISVSKDQERLKAETKELAQSSPQLSEKAEKQNSMLSEMNTIMKMLSDLSQQTFAITPEMGKALGESMKNMYEAIGAMQNRNNSIAVQRQKAAMRALNEAASLMQSGLSQMMQNGGQGMMPLMQQLQQLSQQQMMLNQLTQSLNQGKLTQRQMAQLKRLGQEQETIRKSLEQLNREAEGSGQSKKLSQNLEQILQEMKEVVTSMNTENLNDELVQKQERILSKLLDTQRSINERDFEKKRESREGKLYTRETPSALNLSTEEGKKMIRDALLNSIKEGYSKDYEELIRKYFDLLSKEEKKQ